MSETTSEFIELLHQIIRTTREQIEATEEALQFALDDNNFEEVAALKKIIAILTAQAEMFEKALENPESPDHVRECVNIMKKQLGH